MRNKKTFISTILITTVILFASACGKQAEPVNAESINTEPTETVKEVDTEENMESSKIEDNSENEVDTTEEERNSLQTAPANSEPVSTSAPTPTPVPATTSTPEPVSTPAPSPTPVHEHTWKEHLAQSQTWIPNIVIVDDYETKTIESYVYICDCGFTTTDADTISQHVKDNTRAQAAAGATLTCDGFTIQDHSYTQQVKVGSHEEDQGHYETSTYVDYYYCECGAIK